MSLLERIQDNERCRLPGCPEPRVDGTLFCRGNDHLTDWYMGRIVRLSDGTFVGTAGPHRRFTARDDTGLLRAA